MLYDYEGDGTMSTDYLRKMLIPEAGSVSKARQKKNEKLWAEVELTMNIQGQKSIVFDKFFEWIFKAAAKHGDDE